ncbi:MAG: ATP--guanido phosphotransferase, partial [Oscillospiraceae bacterium]|nr:ATP--guanido phosphotransferase [Oscillospiraceae bacterium]
MSSYWYQQSGADGDVVLSTRIRMARNLPDFPFTAGLNGEQKKQIADRAKEAFDAAGIPYDRLEMAGMQPFDALSLVERHLISPEFARCEEGSWLLLSKDRSVSVMLGEEDHLRIQLMGAGMQPEALFARADALDTVLDSRLGFAFDDRLGYLTQCPTNLGTGMRASLMLHLPALQQRKAVEQLANTVSKLGMTIRGLYGEGSQSEGAIFQLSNQVTL